MSPTVLPPSVDDLNAWNSALLAAALANLGYAGFRHLKSGRCTNPAIVLLAAISRDNLEVRVVEGLPWLVAEYYDLDWDWLTREATARGSQNRLGFIVSLGRRIAEIRGAAEAQRKLRQQQEVLDQARLAREDTLCQNMISEAEREWLRQVRSADARHWNLLTDLSVEHLAYAA